MNATALTKAYLAGHPLPPLSERSGKTERGRVLVVAGGAELAGAPILVGMAALRAGAGRVQLAATKELRGALGTAFPEARILTMPATPKGELSAEAAPLLASALQSAEALAIGPGLADENAACALAAGLIRLRPRALVIDAGALGSLLQESLSGFLCPARTVITPHAGELSKLTGVARDKIEADPLAHAQAAAERFKVTVVLKGPRTIVSAPSHRALSLDANEPGLGTAGSGDVLSGMIAGLQARGADARIAAAWAIYAHAAGGATLAAKHAPLGALARELLDEIPSALRSIGAYA